MAVYDLLTAQLTLTRDVLEQRSGGIWRWSEILPVRAPAFRLTLGDANAPVLPVPNLAKMLGLSALYIKDETHNPLGSLDQRGLVVAVSRGLELGVRDFVMAADGSDGAALAACAARTKARARIYMPHDAPLPEQIAIKTFDAELLLVDGMFTEAAKQAAEAAWQHGWLDLSAFREPYRLEGAKTIGLELAEAFGWNLPDVLIVPTGDGLELFGIWKAFCELKSLGFVGSQLPRMVAVQATGCAPLARAFDQKQERAQLWETPDTNVSGLRVPALFADRPILRAIRESGGTVLAVTDEQILAGQHEIATREGIFASPRGAAGLAAARQLIESGWLGKDERVVLVISGSGLNSL